MNSATIRRLEQRRAAGETLAEEQELELSEERIADAVYERLQAALGGTLRFSIDTLQRRGGRFVAALSLVGAVADWDPDYGANYGAAKPTPTPTQSLARNEARHGEF